MAFAVLNQIMDERKPTLSELSQRQLESVQSIITSLLQDLEITDIEIKEYLETNGSFHSESLSATVAVLKVLASLYVGRNEFFSAMTVLGAIRKIELIDPSITEMEFRNIIHSTPEFEVQVKQKWITGILIPHDRTSINILYALGIRTIGELYAWLKSGVELEGIDETRRLDLQTAMAREGCWPQPENTEA